jgi:NAD(P)-dependent dehydrogenase (short-subunit alcohol dehydrogenase family)
MTDAFLTNATGPYLTLQYFAPLLRSTAHPPARVINVSTGGGSMTLRLDPTSLAYDIQHVPYQTSKAALNMVSACQVYEYGRGENGFKIFTFCPGFTESNLGPQNKEVNGAKPTSEGARPMLAILKGERDGEAGGFLTDGGQWPW